MIKRASFRTKPKKSIIQLDKRTGSSNVITKKKANCWKTYKIKTKF